MRSLDVIIRTEVCRVSGGSFAPSRDVLIPYVYIELDGNLYCVGCVSEDPVANGAILRAVIGNLDVILREEGQVK